MIRITPLDSWIREKAHIGRDLTGAYSINHCCISVGLGRKLLKMRLAENLLHSEIEEPLRIDGP
jgi:hypothetical protein